MEEWAEQIFAEGVDVKCKNERGGRGRGRKNTFKCPTPHPPLHQPSTGQECNYNPRWLHRKPDLSSVPLQNNVWYCRLTNGLFALIPSVLSKALQDVDTILYDFLWGGKGDKIKTTERINNYNKGGLKMIDIRDFNTSLKVKWLQGYLVLNDKGKWKVFFDYYLEMYGGKLLILSRESTTT